MLYPAPTKGFSRSSPDTAKPRHSHAVCTLGCPSPKDIGGNDIMKLKVSQCIYAELVGKGLTGLLHTVYSVYRVLFPVKPG